MRFYIPAFVFFMALLGYSQNPTPFENEVAQIKKKYAPLSHTDTETIVFTGSSSIRMWHDLQERFPDHQIINSGFGGSQATDLLAYSDDLILRYNPSKVFIYEGDNDVASGKKTKAILTTIQQLIDKIRTNSSTTAIILISTKPSLARWKLRRKYQRLNRKFKKFCKTDKLISYADIWSPMLDGRKLIPDLFIEDGLHMNAKGYDIWHSALEPFIDN
ncbi:GDSL-type esterase/lipase family protein [Maribacter polysaccharolyticus]|uniref:GDSL-type esterase/lipase family protein n=1 Tax=Maribacter polysaccharolyticus TaxID=3020831 RepID=UPI00237FA0FA|nr:GDSL-type esterase/lipase family protein [Maribacter polysaccharolyticus]MDE3741898.1 GDSL-type esterase/lipase family protein [Maribacter polysaccharolyticus]